MANLHSVKSFVIGLLLCLVSSLVWAETMPATKDGIYPLDGYQSVDFGSVFKSASEGCTSLAAQAVGEGNYVMQSQGFNADKSQYLCILAQKDNPAARMSFNLKPYCKVGYWSYSDPTKCRVDGASCPPNEGWTLSADKKTCERPDCPEGRSPDGTCKNKCEPAGKAGSATGSSYEVKGKLGSVPNVCIAGCLYD